MAGAALLLAAALPGQAQQFPTKPIRLVVGAPAGGGFDLAARLLGDKLSHMWGQQVIVDNRPGGGHIVASEIVAHAAPDGYTLLVCGANHTLNPLLHKSLPYDTLKDFAPVTMWAKTPFVLEVNPALPAKSIAELVALAKARKGDLKWTASQVNSSSQVAGELFKHMAGIAMTFIAYRGSAPALEDLLADRVSVMFDAPVTSLPYITAGKLRALGVTSAKAEPTLPGVPTIASAGYPGFEVVAWIGVAAPAHTPAAVIDKLNAGFKQALDDPGIRAKLTSQGWDVEPSTPQALDQFIRSEIERYRPIVREANMHAD